VPFGVSSVQGAWRVYGRAFHSFCQIKYGFREEVAFFVPIPFVEVTHPSVDYNEG